MGTPQPETFTLTDAEAAIIQGIQMKSQANIARKSTFLRISSIAAPFVLAGIIWLGDLAFFGGEMPFWLFLTLMATFVAGMLAQSAGYWLTLIDAKKRLRTQTRQVYEPRTVRLADEGIEQSIPTALTMQKWTGVSLVELKKDFALVWAGNLLVISIPVRAFPTPADTEAFVAECQRRAAG